MAKDLTKDLIVPLSPEEAASAIIEALGARKNPEYDLLERPVILVDNYRIDCPSGTVVTLILAKWFARTGDYVNVVVVLSNLTGDNTMVHLCTDRFRRWLRDVDLGAGKSMIGLVEKALESHKVD